MVGDTRRFCRDKDGKASIGIETKGHKGDEREREDYLKKKCQCVEHSRSVWELEEEDEG